MARLTFPPRNNWILQEATERTESRPTIHAPAKLKITGREPGDLYDLTLLLPPRGRLMFRLGQDGFRRPGEWRIQESLTAPNGRS